MRLVQFVIIRMLQALNGSSASGLVKAREHNEMLEVANLHAVGAPRVRAELRVAAPALSRQSLRVSVSSFGVGEFRELPMFSIASLETLP